MSNPQIIDPRKQRDFEHELRDRDDVKNIRMVEHEDGVTQYTYDVEEQKPLAPKGLQDGPLTNKKLEEHSQETRQKKPALDALISDAQKKFDVQRKHKIILWMRQNKADCPHCKRRSYFAVNLHHPTAYGIAKCRQDDCRQYYNIFETKLYDANGHLIDNNYPFELLNI